MIDTSVPKSWDWFCLDKIAYHKKQLTILWDKDGSRYTRGKGFKVYLDDQMIFESDNVEVVNMQEQ